MIVPAIIVNINYTDHTCTVEVPDFKGAADAEPVILEAKILVSPGFTGGYHAGDYVWIGLIRGLKGYPIILGKLFSAEIQDDNVVGQLSVEALMAANSAKLPFNTVFDGIDSNYNSIQKIANKLKETTNYLETNKDLDFKLQKAIEASQITYTNNQPLLQDLGGIKAANHTAGFDNVPITDLLTELLYPYQAPKILSFSMTGSGVYEKGSSVSINSAALLVQKTSQDLKEVVLKKNGATLSTLTEFNLENSQYSINFNLSENLDGQTDVTYTVEVVDETDEIVRSSQRYTFVYPYYIGCLDTKIAISPADISSLNKRVAAKGNFAQSYITNNQYPVVAYPKAYGRLSSITDHNGFVQAWDSSIITLDINGEQIEYYLYIGDISTTTASYKFNY
jgi:hypothetical protein